MCGVRLVSDGYIDEIEDEILPRLKGHIKLLRLVMISCEEKLEVYRDYSDGRYHGGAEHSSLIGRIKVAMEITKPEE